VFCPVQQAFFSYRFILTPAYFDFSAENFPDSQVRAEAAVAKVCVEAQLPMPAPPGPQKIT
jgi:hypothetical protein